ncbi:hypothetical protein C4559_02660 [Candidatus Microgenomates bacterium]|nr:MAG: hypothetical protein C4559_02660 [Candidatus Microgenomates bacterium]
MQAIILAAGKSSRFYPLANDKHKSMVRIMGKPILEYTIQGLKEAGIKEIVLIVDQKKIIQNYFGDGKKFGVSITYVIQPAPLGAGNGLLLAKKYINGDFFLLNGHHLDAGNFIKTIIAKRKENDKAVLLVKQKENIWENGVAKISQERLLDLVEKPKIGEEPSKLCIVGIYLFSREFLSELENTPPEHYQLEKAISSFAKNNFIRAVETKEEVVTLKYPWDLLSLKDFLFIFINRSISEKAKISESAEIIGDVVIEEGASVLEGAKIKGPCYIGKNAFVGNHAVLRKGVDVEENSVIGGYMEMKNTIVMAGSKVHSGFIGDSIISENCRIGAQFCTANVRLDRNSVKIILSSKEVDTNLKSFGMILGKNSKIGIKSSTMPGVIIGENSFIGPHTSVTKNVEDNTKYFSKFQEVIVKK